MAPDVRLVSNSGVLLGFDPDRNDWYAVERPTLALPSAADANATDLQGQPAGARRAAEPPKGNRMERRADELVSPEPFDHLLELGDHLCRVWMLSGTSLRLLAPSGQAAFGIELRRGRIVVRSGSQNLDGVPYRPLSILVVVRDEIWQLELLKPDTQCGLEIVPSYPTRPNEDAKEAGYRGGLYVVSGDVRFTEAVGRQRTLVADRWISLAPADRAVATDTAGSAFRTKGSQSLAWLNPDARRSLGAMAKVAHDFEHEFIPAQPVSLSINTVAKDSRPKISELAVKTLALTGHYQTLVEVLAQVPHEEAVAAAINGLRAWLPLAPDHGSLLEKELSNVLVPPDQGIVLRLLWGYNSDDARDRAKSNQLVAWLDHERLAIRLLAITQIAELTGQTRKYRAGMPPSQRKAAKKDWENYVTRNKGLLKP